jgi:AcrR family transcriptional regulator
MKDKTLHDEVKDYITQAYVALLKEKLPEEISISDLCKKAGVSRMSFYRNFETKESIIENRIKGDLEKLYSNTLVMDVTSRGPILLNEFQYIADNYDFYRALYDRGLTGYLYKWWDYYARLFLQNFDPTANPYEYAFYSGASINVIIRWISGGLVETPEQMARYFDALIADRHRRGEEEARLASGESKYHLPDK